MVTLKDLSLDLGLSVTQVSRALGGHSDVNALTRARVTAAAERLGYRPNNLARGLKTGRSGIVAMSVPRHREPGSNAVLLDIVMGLSEQMSAVGMRFVLHVGQPDEDPVMALRDLCGTGGIDGIIVIEPQVGDPRIPFLAASRTPFVVHGRDPTLAHPGVDIDNAAVARDMVLHLARAGHERLLFVNGPEGSAYAQARRRGFAAGLAEAGLDPALSTLSFGAHTRDRGRDVALTYLTLADRPTGVVAGNAIVARGVYAAAGQLGLAIPDAVSVLAHDDGLTDHHTAQFHPTVGGTTAPLGNAWPVIANKLRKLIADPGSDGGASILPHGFRPGLSAGPKGR